MNSALLDRCRVVAAAFAVLATPSTLIAQDTSSIRLGARVRLTTATGRAVGTLIRRSGDSLFIQHTRDQTRTVSLDSVTLGELSTGKRRHTGRGALIGLVSGAGLGLFTAFVLCQDPCGNEAAFRPLIIAAGTLPGTVLGALVGSQLRSDRWERVPVSRLAVEVGLRSLDVRMIAVLRAP